MGYFLLFTAVKCALELTSLTVVVLLYKTEEIEEDDETHLDDTLVRVVKRGTGGWFPIFQSSALELHCTLGEMLVSIKNVFILRLFPPLSSGLLHERVN